MTVFSCQDLTRSELSARLRDLWRESDDPTVRDLMRDVPAGGTRTAPRPALHPPDGELQVHGQRDRLLPPVRDHEPDVLGTISSRLRKHSYLLDPNDVLQEVFFNIYRYPYPFKAEKPESFRNWANTIIRNTILKFVRDRGRDARLSSTDGELEVREDPPVVPADGSHRQESSTLCVRAYLLYLTLYADQFNHLYPRKSEMPSTWSK